MIVGIIGAGAWGTALGISAAKSGNDVILWSFDPSTDIAAASAAKTYNISLTRDMADLQDTGIWMIATPSQFFNDTISVAREFYNGKPVIICTKGISRDGKLLSDILADIIPECNDIGVLSGPGFAAEVAGGLPTAATIAGTDAAIAAATSAVPGFYIHSTHDIIGTQICGAGKNAVAVIMGYMADKGENEKAMVLTRAWDEVVKIGIAHGAKIETFLDFCGIGDLFLTATSTTSRNYTAGINIAGGRAVQGTVEGVTALRGLTQMANTLGVLAPILSDFVVKL